MKPKISALATIAMTIVSAAPAFAFDRNNVFLDVSGGAGAVVLCIGFGRRLFLAGRTE